MIHAAMYGKGRKALVSALTNRESFVTGGALKGEKWSRSDVNFRDLGRLYDVSPFWGNTFMIDHLAGIDYVVWSYGTPIAWVLTDATVRIPPVKYSTTTSRHQGMMYLLNEEN